MTKMVGFTLHSVFGLDLDSRERLQFPNLGPLNLLSWFNLLSASSAAPDDDVRSATGSGTMTAPITAPSYTHKLPVMVCSPPHPQLGLYFP